MPLSTPNSDTTPRYTRAGSTSTKSWACAAAHYSRRLTTMAVQISAGATLGPKSAKSTKTERGETMSAADKLKQEVVDLAAAQALLEKHRTTEDEAIESGEDAW